VIDIPSILSENQKRIDKLFAPYDPIKGTGGPLKREKLILEELGEYYLPIEFFDHPIGQMFAKAKSLRRFVEMFPDTGTVDLAYDLFINERIKSDFEFWCAYTVKIKPKKEDKSEDDKRPIIPFVLNHPQLKLLAKLEEMRMSGVPIRIILLKARQWGGSTLVQIYIAWYQLILMPGFNSVICTEVESQASNIRGMYTRMITHYPKPLGIIKMSNYEGSTKNKYLADRDCVLSIGSAEKPNTLRSGDIRAAHLSEIGLFQSHLKTLYRRLREVYRKQQIQ
jgi:hypothetical protein